MRNLGGEAVVVYAMAERGFELSYREGRNSIRLVSRDGEDQATGSE